MAEIVSREQIHFEWLLRLRWGATVCQLLIIGLCASTLALDVHWSGVALVLGFALASNAWGEKLRRSGRLRPWVSRALLTLDVALFSALLYFTGGPTNPFSFLYLVYIALGAVVLEPRWSWALAALSFALLGTLYLVSPVPEHHEMIGLHLKGMWVAFGVAAVFIVYFVSRVSSALELRERQLAQARRLASLATLAGGAAHELSTPLSTIAVIARELEQRLGDESGRQDAALVRSEVERCRAILSQLAADAGVAHGEPLERVEVRAWADQVVAELGAAARVQVDAASELSLVGPRRALVQALKSLVDNGLKAGPEGRPVRVSAVQRASEVEVRVEDEGPGIREDLLAHIGEPFFTTRPPGAGMGLGVFLARSVIEQAGGSMRIESKPQTGTRVTLVLPATIRRIPDEARGA